MAEPIETYCENNQLRNRWCRLVFAGIMLSLLYGFQSGVLVHQLQKPVLGYLYLDPTYWLASLTGLTGRISSSLTLAIVFDIFLVLSCVLSTVFPAYRLFPGLFFVLYFVYFIIFNTYGAQHTLNKVGILLLPLAFVVNRRRFAQVWEALRYYTLFIFASAFTWKLFRLSWLNQQQGELILKKNLAGYLFYHPDSTLSKIYFELLEHPVVLQSFFLVGFLLEGSFTIGFFTKKFDRVLLLFMFLLVAGFWFIADAFFGEILIFGFTLLPLKSLTSPARHSQHPVGARSPGVGSIIP